MLEQSEEYLALIEAELAAGGQDAGENIPDPQFIDENLVGNYLYVSLPYIPTDYDAETDPQEVLLESFETQLENIGGSQDAETLSGSTDNLEDFITEYEDYIRYSGYQNTYVDATYFLRGQYADVEDIEISKTFTDTTPPYLQT